MHSYHAIWISTLVAVILSIVVAYIAHAAGNVNPDDTLKGMSWGETLLHVLSLPALDAKTLVWSSLVIAVYVAVAVAVGVMSTRMIAM